MSETQDDNRSNGRGGNVPISRLAMGVIAAALLLLIGCRETGGESISRAVRATLPATATPSPSPSSTPTMTPTTLPTATPTVRPTSTPLPTPDLAGAGLRLDDLPGGYQSVPPEMIGFLAGDPSSTDAFGHTFGYADPDFRHFLFGILNEARAAYEISAFDSQMGDEELLTSLLLGGMGTDAELLKSDPMPEAARFGDASTGRRLLVLDAYGDELRADFVLFRREQVAVILIYVFAAEGEPQLDIAKLAQIIDGRLSHNQ
jgi:hypothetical protein